MERIILEQTLHSKEDRRSLLNFLTSKATRTAARERISMVNGGESVSAEIIATRRRGFDELINQDRQKTSSGLFLDSRKKLNDLPF